MHAVLDEGAAGVTGVWLQHNRRDPATADIRRAARAAGLPVSMADRRELDVLAQGGRHQGIVARVLMEGPAKRKNLNGLLAELPANALLLVLDGVTDPHNLGACLRSADAAGVYAVIVPKDRAVGLTPTVRKVACGAAEHVPLVEVTNLARALRQIKEAGVRVVGTDTHTHTVLFETDLTGSVAVVLGSEGRGLRRLTREHCDALMTIPMVGHVESLNVSVATGVCLFEARRQRLRAALASQV